MIERFLTVSKASGTGSIPEFIRKVQFHLANKDVDKAIVECDKQKGSVGNVMKAGLRRYKEMIHNTELATEQKILGIQKEVEEATALELPMLEKNLVFLSTIASIATLLGLLGTVMGMIRSFSKLGDEGGGEEHTSGGEHRNSAQGARNRDGRSRTGKAAGCVFQRRAKGVCGALRCGGDGDGVGGHYTPEK